MPIGRETDSQRQVHAKGPHFPSRHTRQHDGNLKKKKKMCRAEEARLKRNAHDCTYATSGDQPVVTVVTRWLP